MLETFKVGDVVTFGFEFHRPWYIRLWRRIRRMLRLKEKPRVFRVVAVGGSVATLLPEDGRR